MRLLRVCVALLALLFVVPSSSHAETDPSKVISGPVYAEVISVYDGDTLTVLAHPWPSIKIRISVRIDGMDTPELRGKCPDERALARVAKERLIALAGTHVFLKNIQPGKYAGRMLAEVWTADDRHIALIFIEEGLARAYDGGKRQPWCPPPAPQTLQE